MSLPGPRRIEGNLWVRGKVYAEGAVASVPNVGNYAAGDTTPSVANGVSYLYINNSAPTTITNFDDGMEGQILFLVFANGNTTLSATNIKLVGGVDKTPAANEAILLVRGPVNWHQA